MNDLEKLARHVHEAPEGTIQGAWAKGTRNKPIWFTKEGSSRNYPIITIIAKRDELTGKPKEWINDWARFRAQDADGEWKEYSSKPVKCIDSFGPYKTSDKYQVVNQGEVIGDWRETLEERNMEEDEDLMQSSIGKIIESEQPAWDGEGLPPIGSIVEINVTSEYQPDFNKDEYFVDGDRVEVIAHKEAEACAVAVVWHLENSVASSFIPDVLRPIKTDRERQIEKMVEVLLCAKDDATLKDIAEALYEAGARIEGV